MREMRKKLLQFLFFSAILLTLYFYPNLIEVRAPNGYPIHNIDTCLNYSRIQEALDAPETSDGHTIQIDSGTYYENIVVNKSISILGENKYNTIIDGNNSGTVIKILTNNVTIANFTIKGGGALPDSGIILDHCEKTLLTNNVIKRNNGYAISLHGSRENTIKENIISDNKFGIYIWLCSSYNNITNNLIEKNGVNIHLTWSSNNNITRNTLTNGYKGVNVFYRCLENNIIENIIKNNTLGLMFADGCNYNNVYHNNFIKNTEHAVVFLPNEDIFRGIEQSSNNWDKGYPMGGNYWTNKTQIDLYQGPNQNVSGSDAISDASLILSDDNVDNYPLMYPWRIIRVPSEQPIIQKAINMARPGDTIYVSSGTYHEHLIMNKSVLLKGENKHTTIIDGNGTGFVIIVTADFVNISGFTVQRGGTEWWDDCGSIVLFSNNNIVNQNIFKDTFDALAVDDSNNNTFSQNTVLNMTGYGMRLYRCSDIKITENNITHTKFPGIFMSRSANDCEIRGNFVTDTSGGIYLATCNGNNIVENRVTNSSFGIGLELSSSNNVIRKNIVMDCFMWGLGLGPHFSPYRGESPFENIIVENIFVNNEIGIQTWWSMNNLICRNNFTNNKRQFNSQYSKDIWDDGLNGNYWSDYMDNYPNATEVDDSGVMDMPYIIDENNQDNYPLVPEFPSFVLLLLALTSLLVTRARLSR